MEFKDNLRNLREEKGLSPAELAVAFGKSESAIRMWETGRSKPDADTLIALSHYFECTSDYLLGLSKYRNENDKQDFLNEITFFGDAFRDLISDIPRNDARKLINNLVISIRNIYFHDEQTASITTDRITELLGLIALMNDAIFEIIHKEDIGTKVSHYVLFMKYYEKCFNIIFEHREYLNSKVKTLIDQGSNDTSAFDEFIYSIAYDLEQEGSD